MTSSSKLYRVPYRTFVIPPAVPVVVYLLMAFASVLGADLNIHFGAGFIVVLLFFWSLGAAAMYVVLVPRAIIQLLNNPTLRSRKNVLATTVAASFLSLVVFFCVVYLLSPR